MQQNTTASSWPRWLLETVSLDYRGLSALRIGLAAILVVDLIYRVGDLTPFYTDEGIFPRSSRLAMAWGSCEPWWMSLHMLNGSYLWAATLAAVAFVAAIALLVGYRTRAALLASWILLYSIQARFPMLLQGGDTLLRCVLFWMLFLPIDARWSVASRRNDGSLGATGAASVATLAFMVQVGSMYFFSALLKTAPSWTRDFSATYYALRIDHFTSPLGYALSEQHAVLPSLTIAAMTLELAGPILILLPIGRGFWRWMIPGAMIAFHLGLSVCLDLGTFPWICIVCWLAILPSPFWDAIEFVARVPHRRESSTVQPQSGLLTNGIAAFLLWYIVTMNIGKLSHPLATVGVPPVSLLGKLTGLEQYWNLFAPGPYHYGGWVRIEGETSTGELVNLYQPGEPLSSVKPANVSASYTNQNWRRCIVVAYEIQEKLHLQGICRYLALRWNQTHDPSDRVVRARYVHMVVPVPPPGSAEDTLPVERRVLEQVDLLGTEIGWGTEIGSLAGYGR